jgi:tetratricopeptide (TPR) repeat protein
MFKGKPRFEQLDEYILRRDYALALEAIAEEIKKRPENFNLLLRQAEILGLAGDREKAISVYRDLAEHYAEQGFYARAIAVINKVLRLDPARQDVTRELADLIAAKQQAEEREQAKLEGSEKGRGKRSRKSAPVAREAPPETGPASPPSTDAVAQTAERQADRERAASRFFAELPRAALEEILGAAAVRSFEPHQAIVHEGEAGTSFFLIEEGEVEVHTKDTADRPLVLARLGVGDFFGEVAVLTGKPRTATIIATTPVTVIEISSGDLARIAEGHPEVRTVLQHFYERRAQATVEAMVARMRGRHA